jgi:hypothetical protein
VRNGHLELVTEGEYRGGEWRWRAHATGRAVGRRRRSRPHGRPHGRWTGRPTQALPGLRGQGASVNRQDRACRWCTQRASSVPG